MLKSVPLREQAYLKAQKAYDKSVHSPKSTQGSARKAYDQAADSAKQTYQSAVDKAQQAYSSSGSSSKSAYSYVAGSASAAYETVSNGASKAYDSAAETADDISKRLRSAFGDYSTWSSAKLEAAQDSIREASQVWPCD